MLRLYNVVLFLHITSVVLAFGPTFSYPLVFAFARRGERRHLPFLHRMQAVIGQRLIGPVSGLILLTGLYLAADGPFGFDTAFVGAGLLIVVVLGALGGAYFARREPALAELAERDVAASGDGAVELSDEYERLFRQVRTVTLLAQGLVLLAIFLMVTKAGV